VNYSPELLTLLQYMQGENPTLSGAAIALATKRYERAANDLLAALRTAGDDKVGIEAIGRKGIGVTAQCARCTQRDGLVIQFDLILRELRKRLTADGWKLDPNAQDDLCPECAKKPARRWPR